MPAANRSKTFELHEHTPGQFVIFIGLAFLCTAVLFFFVAVPLMEGFFKSFLRNATIRDGTTVSYHISEKRADDTVTTGLMSTWGLVDERDITKPRGPNSPLPADYVFRPLLAFTPLVAVGGFVLAALITCFLPGGYVRQKIQREIQTMLDHLSVAQYGEHTPDEIKQLTRDIASADLRRLHDLADGYHVPYADLELLQGAIHWRDAQGLTQWTKTHDAIKFYMREYFTERYSNTVLGLVYMGAAVLIIVIGIRGLKFLPSTDPSIVLGALGLEFMLLITYALVMIYGKPEDSGQPVHSGGSLTGSNDQGLLLDGESEQVLRAFLAIRREPRGDA